MPETRQGEGLFCRSETNVQKAWDSTSLTRIMECPRKYQLSIINGWRPNRESTSLKFGQLFHSALETFDKLQEANKELALIAAVRYCLEETTYKIVSWLDEGGVGLYQSQPVRPDDQPLPPDGAEGLVRTEELAFWQGAKTKNRRTLVQSVVWYTENFKNDVAEPIKFRDGSQAIEVSFRIALPINNPDGDPYVYCGHIDKAVSIGGTNYILERKTTASPLGTRYFEQFSPNNQISSYAAAAKVIFSMPFQGVIVDAVQVAVGFSAFSRSIIPRTSDQLDEWLKNTIFWIEQAEFYARKEFWPMNITACSNYGGCEFRGVCSKDPSVRRAFLVSDFNVNPWNPLLNKEERKETNV